MGLIKKRGNKMKMKTKEQEICEKWFSGKYSERQAKMVCNFIGGDFNKVINAYAIKYEEEYTMVEDK